MSYLNAVRLHFAGKFRADVSTVNNDPTHYDEATFVCCDQLIKTPTDKRGWWQPAGTSAWRLSDCAITAAVWGGTIATTSADDPVVGLALGNTSDRVDAKLVDLDPDQQMVSMIFGLEVRIVDTASRRVLMTGQFTPAPFMDLWKRFPGPMGANKMCAFYQSTLTDVVWGDLSSSPALQALEATTLPGQLSMHFVVDDYVMAGTHCGFGRIVGTIGPQLVGDPVHFVAGRQLAAAGTANFGNVTCSAEPVAGQILVDLGNALPMQVSGAVLPSGDLHLVAVRSATDVIDLGSFGDYAAPDFYATTAGILSLPVGGTLTAAQLAAFADLPLAIAIPTTSGSWPILAQEAFDGIYARADAFVERMNPGDSPAVSILVTRFGLPLVGQTIVPTITDSNSNPILYPPIAAQMSGTTGTDGWTTMTLIGSDPGNPRGFIDGQVYFVQFRVEGAADAGTAFDPFLFVSVLLFGITPVPSTVTWTGDVLPILQQYANLYPRPHGPDYYKPYGSGPPLHPVVSLTDQDWVAAFAPRILTALGLPIEHPNHMPVTRDLSEGRRDILQRWMQQVILDELPIEPGLPDPADAALVFDAAPMSTGSGGHPGGRMEDLLRMKSGAFDGGEEGGDAVH